MFVNPSPFTNGVEEDGVKAATVEVTVSEVRGYQGNPFVLTEDNEMKRETYEMQKMIDPGDPSKEREIYHMFPGSYEFTSDVYVNVPKDCVAWLIPTDDCFRSGVTVESKLLPPGFKGLLSGILRVDGGEMFLQPGMPIAELAMAKLEVSNGA